MRIHFLFRFAEGNPGGSRRIAVRQGATQCGRSGVDEKFLTDAMREVSCGNCWKSIMGRSHVSSGAWQGWLRRKGL